MSEITCIIIEDEPLAVKVLSDYIGQVPYLRLEKVFRDAILATEWLHDHQVQLIFLDIHLPKLKGMAFLKTLKRKPAIILTTAYHEYAVEAFDLNVIDYLLKPYEFERFLAAINKVPLAQPKKEEKVDETVVRDFLFITVQKKKVKILFSDILYIESQKQYIKVVTAKKEYLSKISTHEIEDLLPAHLFVRIHRSFIIALSKIDSYTAEEVGIHGFTIPIGRNYRSFIENL